MTSKTFTAKIQPVGETSMTTIEVPFDPKPVFGKVRAPVVVKIGTHTFRSTIVAMGGGWWVPLRRSNREAAGVKAGQRVKVTMTLDEKPRTVETPKDLRAALKKAGLVEAWKSLSYTHQREHVEAIEGAKKAETRDRRIAKCVEMVGERKSVKRKA